MVEQLILNHGISTDKQRWYTIFHFYYTLFYYVESIVEEYWASGINNNYFKCLFDLQRSFLKINLNHLNTIALIRHCNCCSGLTCRTLSELGSSGLHHPAEAVRKVSERILVLVYKVNPRLVRKQLPPDDDITRRNLLYRQLFHEFDLIDLQVYDFIIRKNIYIYTIFVLINYRGKKKPKVDLKLRRLQRAQNQQKIT